MPDFLQTQAPTDPVSQRLTVIAAEALQVMQVIADAASAEFEASSPRGTGAMGAGNDFNSPELGRNLGRVQSQSQRAAYDLAREPFIARVKVQAEGGAETVYYFGRNHTSNAPGIRMVGYTSGAPVAPLAALEIGDPFTLPSGKEVVVIETGRYVPRHLPEGWDGRDTTIAHAEFEPVGVPSLRAILRGGVTFAPDDPFAAFDQPVVWVRAHRESLKGTSLREQVVLNKVQDHIFRLPLNRQVMLEGPPGTGKTSTLIKRLAQKLALTRESAAEFKLIEDNTLGVAHRDSWIMFSPTVLLERYLSEAFNKDNVAAGQEHIWTWADYRNDLATRVLGLLRSGGRRTGFQRDDAVQHLSAVALADQPGLHAAFDRFLSRVARTELDTALATLRDSGEADLREAAQRIANRLPVGASILATFLAVDAQSDVLRAWVTGAREALNRDIARWVDVIARRRSAEMGQLQQIVARMNASDPDDEDDDEDETLELEVAPATTGEALRRAMRGAIRALSMAAANKRAVARTSIYRPIVDWLGTGAIPEADLQAMGRIHGLSAAVIRVTLVTRNHFSKLPKRYRAFRRAAPAPWFLPQAAEAVKLTSDELDLLVAVHLDAAHELLSSPQVRASMGQGNLQVLAPLQAEFRNQVVVDEATDFPPLQLRAMGRLATPGIRSFFACGDFNQRLTAYGVAARAALEWAVPGIEFHEVTRSYRQSAELRGFADRLITLAGGRLVETEAEGERGAAGLAPAFHLAADPEGQSRWIAARISEIADLHRDLPSIAVFVPDEGQVDRVAQELRTTLAEINIDVEACKDGKDLGRDHHVRVFCVDHIKGLEFEAAFFHSVQDLARDRPDLFDNFLYVGATRAATFLGLAASGRLPPVLAQATEGLADQWGTNVAERLVPA
jgi:UvrD-like helicase C-terminal domain